MTKPVQILAIDDEQIILDSIVKLCSSEGWTVDTAENAETGLEKIRKHSYALIISDIMMPGMDGFELLDTLRDMEVVTPVIITTGYSTVENAVRSLYNGAIDFLPKPFTVDELISSVSRGIRYHEIQQTLHHEDHDEVLFVPCPAKYNRLGYNSWALVTEDGSVRVGVVDLFLRTVQTVESIELLQPEDELIQGNSCAEIHTDDGKVHPFLAPLSGRIVETNADIGQTPTLLEKDPYFKGWVYTIIPADLNYEFKMLIPCTAEI